MKRAYSQGNTNFIKCRRISHSFLRYFPLHKGSCQNIVNCRLGMIRGIIGQLFKLKNTGFIQKVSGIQIILHSCLGCVAPAGAIHSVFVCITHGTADQISILIVLIIHNSLPVQSGVLPYKKPVWMCLLQFHQAYLVRFRELFHIRITATTCRKQCYLGKIILLPIQKQLIGISKITSFNVSTVNLIVLSERNLIPYIPLLIHIHPDNLNSGSGRDAHTDSTVITGCLPHFIRVTEIDQCHNDILIRNLLKFLLCFPDIRLQFRIFVLSLVFCFLCFYLFFLCLLPGFSHIPALGCKHRKAWLKNQNCTQ